LTVNFLQQAQHFFKFAICLRFSEVHVLGVSSIQTCQNQTD